MNNEHVYALVKTIDGAHFHTIRVFTFNAIIEHDKSHGYLPLRRTVCAYVFVDELIPLQGRRKDVASYIELNACY
jgi:hypothetical protein